MRPLLRSRECTNEHAAHKQPGVGTPMLPQQQRECMSEQAAQQRGGRRACRDCSMSTIEPMCLAFTFTACSCETAAGVRNTPVKRGQRGGVARGMRMREAYARVCERRVREACTCARRVRKACARGTCVRRGCECVCARPARRALKCMCACARRALVLDERDERTEDDGNARGQQRRQLSRPAVATVSQPVAGWMTQAGRQAAAICSGCVSC